MKETIPHKTRSTKFLVAVLFAMCLLRVGPPKPQESSMNGLKPTLSPVQRIITTMKLALFCPDVKAT